MSKFERKQISLYSFHTEWIDHQDEDFNFSEWVREKIEEEASDAPAFMEVGDD